MIMNKDFYKLSDDEKYKTILKIGKSGEVGCKELVLDVYSRERDPMLRRLCLQVLCRFWGGLQEHEFLLRARIEKLDDDPDDDIRLMAIDCIGDLLAEKPSRDLVARLYDIFSDPKERQIVRESAYCALARFSGILPNDLPSAARHFDLVRDIDRNVIDKAVSYAISQ